MSELESKGQLSQIMSAEAKIGMNEVVSVQLAKYETGLYDKKDALSQTINDLQKDLEMHNKVALKGANFKKYVGVKIPALGLISKLKGDPTLSWEEGEIHQTVGLYHTDSTKRDDTTGFSKKFSIDIAIQHVGARNKMLLAIENTSNDLKTTISAISNMSRKERQVKARISEIRLKEAGIDLAADEQLAQLVKID
jgi:hypothetical protein